MRHIKYFLVAIALLISGCTQVPDGIEPVRPFDLNRYLGKWYEIARLDHSFERGLSRVTAEYAMRNDGGVRVINRGYSEEEQSWEQAEGKAYFVRSGDEAYLKVSFFGPFYASYIVFDLDSSYRYAFVTGPDRSYLWLLSRTPDLSQDIKQQFITRADALGFNTTSLIWVSQQEAGGR